MTSLEKLLNNSEKLADKQTEMNLTLTRLTLSVEEHVKRSNLLEEDLKAVRADIQPLKDHVSFMKTTGENLWLVTKVASTLAAIIGVFSKLISSFKT